MRARTRCAPSSTKLDLDDVFREGSRLHVFLAARYDQPHCTATIETPEPLTLQIDRADLAAGALEVDSELFLGFSAGPSGMLYLSRTRIVELEGRRMTVAHPAVPFKMPRRDYARAPLAWPFELARPGEPPTSWRSLNVSAGGVLVVPETEDPKLAIGEVVSARFSVPDWRDIEVQARIVRRASCPLESGALGLQFLDLPEIDENKIQLRALRAIGRRYLRVRVRVPCEITIDGSPAAHAETVDLSGSGALLEIADEGTWAVGRRGAISLTLDDDPLVVGGISLVRVQRSEGSVQLAVDFPQMSASARTRLVEFVMARLRHV